MSALRELQQNTHWKGCGQCQTSLFRLPSRWHLAGCWEQTLAHARMHSHSRTQTVSKCTNVANACDYREVIAKHRPPVRELKHWRRNKSTRYSDDLHLNYRETRESRPSTAEEWKPFAWLVEIWQLIGSCFKPIGCFLVPLYLTLINAGLLTAWPVLPLTQTTGSWLGRAAGWRERSVWRQGRREKDGGCLD